MHEKQSDREYEEQAAEEWSIEYRAQVAYVKAEQDSIRQQYGSDFIAVQNCKVIDHDKDKAVLARRLSGKVAEDKFLLLSTLEDVLNPEEVFMGGPREE